MPELQKNNLIVDLTLEFAIEIVKYCEVLESNKNMLSQDNYFGQVHQSEQALEKPKTPRANPILSISLK